MGVMSDVHASACTTIYDILRNRLYLPEEESTYELAVDIFEAIVDDLEVVNTDSSKTLELFDHKLDFEVDTLRDLCEERNTKYNHGYFNALHDAKNFLMISKNLVSGEPYYMHQDKALGQHDYKL